MKTLTKRQAITYTIFFILLATRVSTSLFAVLYSGFLSAEGFSTWAEWLEKETRLLYLFFPLGSFPLIAIVVMLNRDDLQSLNIDKFFIFIFLCSGLIILSASIMPFDWVAGIATISIFYLLLKNKLKFSANEPNVWKFRLSAAGVLVIGLLIASSFLNLSGIERTLNLFLFVTIPSTVYEEVVYGGLLWLFLRNYTWSENKIFLIQALLFWLSHIHHLIINPLQFWVLTPAVSFLLGYIVLRSKSITVSLITHLLINFFFRYDKGFFIGTKR